MWPAEQNPALAWARGIAEGLVASGVHHVCISPGARSAPLVFAISERTALRTTIHHDERAAAFFALGLARASARPVALVCTSGSAAANWFPAVVEASMGYVPLVLLSADRPPSLRDCGASQAIDQHGLFGGYVRWFTDPGVPPADPDACSRARRIIERAVVTALGPRPGPVHVNLPFDEPLIPLAGDEWPLRLVDDAPVEALCTPSPGPPPAVAIAQARAALDTASRVVVICGASPMSATERAAARALADAFDAPLIADPISGMRWPDDGRVSWAADLMLGDAEVREAMVPDAFVRFGAMPTSKPVLRWLTELPDVPRVVLDPLGAWREPTWGTAVMIPGDAVSAAEALSSHQQPGGARAVWRATFDAVHRAVADEVDAAAARGELPDEGSVAATVVRSLRDGDALHVASSMPVRDVDALGRPSERAVHVFSNRGANGIDGMVSSALGAAVDVTRRGGRLTALLGDVAALHDLGGFAAAHAAPMDATIVVVNNDGGGIFGMLPLAAFGEVSERAFGTPHGRELRHIAAMFDLGYERVEGPDGVEAALERARGVRGVTVVEVRTHRASNVASWRALRRHLGAVALHAARAGVHDVS